MKYEVIVHNRQGASETFEAKNLDQAKRVMYTYDDPENIKVTIWVVFANGDHKVHAVKDFDRKVFSMAG